MSCCGQGRRSHERMSGQAYERGEITRTAPPAGSVFFEYVGGTAMTVVGPVTGRRYRFGWPGAQVAIDEQDAHLLQMHVRNLRIIEA